MFNLGFWEMVVLAVIALVVVGPERLPGLAKNVGKFLNDLKRTTNTITSEINSTMDEKKFEGPEKAEPKKVTSTEEQPVEALPSDSDVAMDIDDSIDEADDLAGLDSE